jgi:DNA-binding MarR family transcriptional regulator
LGLKPLPRVIDSRPKAETGNESLGDVLEFMRTLWALDHGLQSASKGMSTRLGVTGPQRLVVRMVGRYPHISAGDLARLLHVHPSTLTGVLQRLEARELIERRPDPADQRRALLHLTAAGRRVDSVRGGTVEATVRKVLARLPPSQVKATMTVLSALAQQLTSGETGSSRSRP